MAVYGGLAAFAWCVICLPVVLRAAAYWEFFDPPGPLKLHTRRIPRVGGIAVASAFAIGMLVSGSGQSLRYLLGTLFVLWLAGIIDDLRGLSPISRLMAQVIVASVLCFGADLTIPFPDKKPLGWIVAGLLVMSLINAFNLLDGADGVAAGVAAVIGVGFLVDGAQSGASGVSAATLIGSCLAFLAFNFPPAKIFLGDSGSTSLGLIVAFTGLEVHKANPSTKAGIFLLPIFAGLPLLDLALAILRRLRSGGSPFSGDRRHFYDLLLQKGWSSRKVALSTYAITAGFVLVGLECNRHSLADAICLVLLVTIPFLLIAVRLGALRPAL